MEPVCVCFVSVKGQERFVKLRMKAFSKETIKAYSFLVSL